MSVVSYDVRGEVGAFLRRARELRRAEEYPSLIRRRRHVPHLTQADVAELAGISEAVVAQVERGRYANITMALVIKLAVALRLPPAHEQYLLNFLHPANGNIEPVPRELPSMLTSFVRASMPNPALIISPRFDILYWNRNAAQLLGDFGAMVVERRNVAVTMFLETEMRERWVGWERHARNLVGGMRMYMSRNVAYREDIARLAAWLGDRDRDFRNWWQTAEPREHPDREKDLVHPEHGLLRMYETASTVLGSPHHLILLLTPRDERTEDVFARMASAEQG